MDTKTVKVSSQANGARIRELRKQARRTQVECAAIAWGTAASEVTWARAERSSPERPIRILRRYLEEIGQTLTNILGREVTLEEIVIADPPVLAGVVSSPALSWNKTAVLVLGFGKVPEGVFANSKVDSILMVPLAGRPVIFWLLEYLQNLGCVVFRIGVRRGTRVEPFVRQAFKNLDVEFVEPEADRGPGYTLRELLRSLRSSPRTDIDSVLAVLGDTHFALEDETKPTTSFVLLHKTPDIGRWARFGGFEEPDGSQPRFIEKSQPGIPGENLSLIGVYYFFGTDAVSECAEALAKREGHFQITEILNAMVRKGCDIDPMLAAKWYDAGHADTQIQSHQNLLEEAPKPRGFHYITVKSDLGVLRKGIRREIDPRSPRIESFVDQIQYLRLLPQHYNAYFPRLLSFDDRWPGVDMDDRETSNGPFIEMDYVCAPTLQDLFLFGNLDLDAWEWIFKRLRATLLDFSRLWRPASPSVVINAYYEKTQDRLGQLLTGFKAKAQRSNEDRQMENILLRRMSVDRNIGLSEFLKTTVYPEVVKIARKITRFTLMHGDFCASNILFDPSSGIIKLIDPRGSFGGMKGIYGAQQYDYAKLYHSIVAGYDFIVNDLFELHNNNQVPMLTIEQGESEYHRELCDRFRETFFKNNIEVREREILLLTALLFSSMPPLHYDHPRRQVAMLCKAVELFEQWAKLN